LALKPKAFRHALASRAPSGIFGAMHISRTLLCGAVAFGALVGCGGGGTTSGAALQVSVLPSDTRTVNARRLEELANLFEANFTCTPQDTIAIHGVAPLTYTVEGCGHLSVYQQACQRVSAGGYAQYNRCQWNPLADDLMTRAAADFHCQPDTMDAQPAEGQVGRVVMGCGYSATYVLQCQGVCVWALSGQIVQIGPVTQTEPVNGGVSNGYIQQ
jgi:hypothetical protein